MLLSFSEEELDSYIDSADSGGNDSYDYTDENETGPENWGNDDTPPPKQSNKRKAPAATPKKRGRPLKKAKVSNGPARRLHYRLKGRETGEGMMFYEPYKGYPDFDESYTSFKGKANCTDLSNDMQGLKTDNEPCATAEPWSTFTEAAYERERVNRWKR